jgi:hypothetical protein
MAPPRRVKMHQSRNEVRQFLGADPTYNAAAPAGAVFSGTQILPLVRRNVSQGIIGRSEDKLR